MAQPAVIGNSATQAILQLLLNNAISQQQAPQLAPTPIIQAVQSAAVQVMI